MKLETVLLPVREDLGEQRVFFGDREFLAEGNSCADVLELPKPGVERAFRHVLFKALPDHAAGPSERVAKIVKGDRVQDYDWRVLPAGQGSVGAVSPAPRAEELLNGPTARSANAGPSVPRCRSAGRAVDLRRVLKWAV
jgi:hypothetical protein